VFAGSWPESVGRFDAAVVVSNSNDLVDAAKGAADTLIRIPPAPLREDASISMQWSEAAAALAAPFAGLMPRLLTRAQEATFAGATLIHPGSGSSRKNWPLERFIELSRRLEGLGHRVVWIRGPAEMGQPEAWTGERLDRPSLQALAATLAASRLFIGNDSGVSHLAAAVGAPTVALFGPTSQTVWRPDGPRVRVVDSADGTMAGVSLEAVLGEAKASLHHSSAGAPE
jgi:heptosyltransferase III